MTVLIKRMSFINFCKKEKEIKLKLVSNKIFCQEKLVDFFYKTFLKNSGKIKMIFLILSKKQIVISSFSSKHSEKVIY